MRISEIPARGTGLPDRRLHDDDPAARGHDACPARASRVVKGIEYVVDRSADTHAQVPLEYWRSKNEVPVKPIRHAPVLVRALLGALLSCTGATAAGADAPWIEGRHYVLLDPPVPTQVPPGKVEVVEVFSFGCPACNQFEPIMQQVKAGLPPEAEVVYVPASWNAAESWPLFQRAFHVAQVLGIEAQVHGPMYAAIWETGELAVVDPLTHRLKVPRPTIGLVARFFARTAGVTQQAVLDAARSIEVDMKMMESDRLVQAYAVEGTPTLVVAGKYRVVNSSVRSVEELAALVRFLVERNRESVALAPSLGRSCATQNCAARASRAIIGGSATESPYAPE